MNPLCIKIFEGFLIYRNFAYPLFMRQAHLRGRKFRWNYLHPPHLLEGEMSMDGKKKQFHGYKNFLAPVYKRLTPCLSVCHAELNNPLWFHREDHTMRRDEDSKIVMKRKRRQRQIWGERRDVRTDEIKSCHQFQHFLPRSLAILKCSRDLWWDTISPTIN